MSVSDREISKLHSGYYTNCQNSVGRQDGRLYEQQQQPRPDYFEAAANLPQAPTNGSGTHQYTTNPPTDCLDSVQQVQESFFRTKVAKPCELRSEDSKTALNQHTPPNRNKTPFHQPSVGQQDLLGFGLPGLDPGMSIAQEGYPEEAIKQPDHKKSDSSNRQRAPFNFLNRSNPEKSDFWNFFLNNKSALKKIRLDLEMDPRLFGARQCEILFQEREKNPALLFNEVQSLSFDAITNLPVEKKWHWCFFMADFFNRTNRIPKEQARKMAIVYCNLARRMNRFTHLEWYSLIQKTLILMDDPTKLEVAALCVKKAVKIAQQAPKYRSEIFKIAMILHDLNPAIGIDLLQVKKLVKGYQITGDYRKAWYLLQPLVLLLCKQGRNKTALKFLENNEKQFKKMGMYWVFRAQMMPCNTEEDQEKISQVLLKGLKHVPKSGELWCEYARFCLTPTEKAMRSLSVFDQNQLMKAEDALLKAIKLTPQYGDSFIEMLKLLHIQELVEIRKCKFAKVSKSAIDEVKQFFKWKKDDLRKNYVNITPQSGLWFDLLSSFKNNLPPNYWEVAETLVSAEIQTLMDRRIEAFKVQDGGSSARFSFGDRFGTAFGLRLSNLHLNMQANKISKNRWKNMLLKGCALFPYKSPFVAYKKQNCNEDAQDG